MTVRIRIPREEARSVRRFRASVLPEAPLLGRIGLAVSLLLHFGFLAVVGIRGRSQPVPATKTYEASLQPPPTFAPSPVPAKTDAASVRGAAEDGAYWAAVRGRIERRIRRAWEPGGGVERTGTIVVRLEITTEGVLVSAEIVDPGVRPALEQLVLDAVHATTPFPAPRSRRGERIPLVVFLPVRFAPA